MDKITNLKKQLLEALLDYYIDQHNKDIEDLTNSYNNYNTSMKKLYSANTSASYKDKFWDVCEVPNSLKNCFSITDRFVVENVHLLTLHNKLDSNLEYIYSVNTSAGYSDYKISYYKNSNYILVIKL